MTTKQTGIRFPELTQRQLSALCETTGMNQSAVVITAIDRMYHQEKQTMKAKNAQEAVKLAKSNPETWIGDGKHDEQVCFANGVYTVASNGDAEDFQTADAAADALKRQWQQEDNRS